MNRVGEIEPVVDRFATARLEAAQTAEQKAAVLRFAADLLTRAQLFDAAERRYSELIELTPGDGHEAYALWLATRGRIDEAMAVCREKLSPADPARGKKNLIRVLTIAASRSKSPESLAGKIDDIEAEVLQSKDANVPLLLELGVLRVMQGRDAEALRLYEQALHHDPENVAVLNNLSLVLAEMPDRHEDALRCVDRAVDTAPNSSELLDTKALVLIGVGRAEEAHVILERLCRLSNKNPRFRLHLAMALHQMNQQAESRRNLDQALQDGLSDELLTPSERRLLASVDKEEASARSN
jgi:tetratricopeptide (TPR) repeat protein